MLTTSRRTWHRHHVGCLHLTVEADPISADRNIERHRGLTAVTEQLANLCDTNRLPATWAVGEPGHSPLTAQLTLSEVRHELALSGDETWIGRSAGRAQFARELGRRITQARAAGVDLLTLVPRVGPVSDHMDLVVRHGLRAIVSSERGGNHRYQTSAPQAVHYGVWEFAVTQQLPLAPSFLWSARRRVLRGIRRTASEAATFHLMIDASAVERQGRSAVTTIAWLMRRIAVLRDRGLLRVETLGAAAARLSDLPAATPQRSILRMAA